MQRRGEQRVARRELDDAAEIHHGDAMADVLHDREIVRDEEVGDAEFSLQVDHQVDHLRLHRNVERRDRLVGNDDAGLRASARAMPSRWRWPPENSCG